jgi:hypothetical protein
VARSPVTGFSQIPPTWIGVRSGAPSGSGCDLRTITIAPIGGVDLDSMSERELERLYAGLFEACSVA